MERERIARELEGRDYNADSEKWGKVGDYM